MGIEKERDGKDVKGDCVKYKKKGQKGKRTLEEIRNVNHNLHFFRVAYPKLFDLEKLKNLFRVFW